MRTAALFIFALKVIQFVAALQIIVSAHLLYLVGNAPTALALIAFKIKVALIKLV